MPHSQPGRRTLLLPKKVLLDPHTIPDGTACEVSVCTYNVRGIMDRYHERRALLCSEIASIDADLFAFQEILTGEFAQERHFLPSDFSVFGCRAAMLNLFESGGIPALLVHFLYALLASSLFRFLLLKVPEWAQAFAEACNVYNSGILNFRTACMAPFFGNSIASRLPITRHDTLSLKSFRAAHRILAWLPASCGGLVPLWLVNTHLAHDCPETRARQAEKIITWVCPVADQAAAVVILGDLNAPPEEPLHEIFAKAGFRSGYSVVHGQEPESTWPSGIQAPLMDHGDPHCADYVYVRSSPGVRVHVVSAEVRGNQPAADDETLFPSDHFALKITLRISSQVHNEENGVPLEEGLLPIISAV